MSNLTLISVQFRAALHFRRTVAKGVLVLANKLDHDPRLDMFGHLLADCFEFRKYNQIAWVFNIFKMRL